MEQLRNQASQYKQLLKESSKLIAEMIDLFPLYASSKEIACLYCSRLDKVTSAVISLRAGIDRKILEQKVKLHILKEDSQAFSSEYQMLHHYINFKNYFLNEGDLVRRAVINKIHSTADRVGISPVRKAELLELLEDLMN